MVQQLCPDPMYSQGVKFTTLTHRTGPQTPQNNRTGPPKITRGVSPCLCIPRVDQVILPIMGMDP